MRVSLDMRLDKLLEVFGNEKIDLHLNGVCAEQIRFERAEPLATASEGSVSFIGSPKYLGMLENCQASLLISYEYLDSCPLPQLVHKNPQWLFARATSMLHPIQHPFSGVSEQAHIAQDASLAEDVSVAAGAFIGVRARIGRSTVIYPGAYIGEDVEIGEDCVVYPNVVIREHCIIGNRVIAHAGCVIGADGFGFCVHQEQIQKVPQIGRVRVSDDVEIGACSTIDRATFGETLIGRGCKLDSHVHVAHNVEIGENCMFAAMTGIAGSTKLGNWILSGGHSGFSGHLTVCDRVSVGAKTGVVTDVDTPGVYMGFPQQPAATWRRQTVHLRRLADYEKRLKALESKLSQTLKEDDL